MVYLSKSKYYNYNNYYDNHNGCRNTPCTC